MITSRGTLFLALTAIVALITTPVVRADETESTTYTKIEPSLALVGARHGKSFGFGTAFCIADLGGNNGLLLTNQHVVAGDPYPRVILMSNRHKVLNASVVRTSPLDAAVLLIPSDCRPLRLSSTLPAVGARIGLAGFPSIQLEAASAGLGLSPSFHEGSISSILAEAGLLQYDAQTDHGNSGSPLFDVDSGTVYGLVRAGSTGATGALQNNFAITIPMLAPFLQNAHAPVSYVNGSGVASATTTQLNTNLPNVGGTYVGSLYDTMAGNGAFTVTLLQDGKTLVGTWAAEFSSNRNYNNSGEVRGTVLGPTSAAFYLLSSVSNFCPYLATVVVGSAELRGTYASHNCTVANGGSFTAQRTDSTQQANQGEQSTPNAAQKQYVPQAKSTPAVTATNSLAAQPGSVAASIDLRCGSGTVASLYKGFNTAFSELNGNDYTSATSDARKVVESASTCAVMTPNLCYGASGPCGDQQYVTVLGVQLSGQQILRIATARMNGDSLDALRNEIMTVLDVCTSPNILSNTQPYQSIRVFMTSTIATVQKMNRIPNASGILDVDGVRACATKLGLSF
jgi:S1-C subfamily serine protease